jgi:hypothetical protein
MIFSGDDKMRLRDLVLTAAALFAASVPALATGVNFEGA